MDARLNEIEQALDSINNAIATNHEEPQNLTANQDDEYFEKWVKELKSFWVTERKLTQLKGEVCNICLQGFKINQRMISLK